MSETAAVTRIDDDAWWRVTMGGSKGNILDTALMDALFGVFDEAKRTPTLKAIVLEGAGTNFSFGASVEEHLPAQVAGMLTRFGSLMYAVLESGVVVLGAVRGQCLGGGLELLSLSHRIFATSEARFGQPEIVLGVFAARRIGAAARAHRPRARRRPVPDGPLRLCGGGQGDGARRRDRRGRPG